jgi:hypothetical protein
MARINFLPYEEAKERIQSLNLQSNKGNYLRDYPPLLLMRIGIKVGSLGQIFRVMNDLA